jgi:hypothetical protein
MLHRLSAMIVAVGAMLTTSIADAAEVRVIYSAGLAAKSTAPELGRGFIAFLARPAFKAKFAEAGLDDTP